MQKETLQTFVTLDATKAWLPQSHIASGTPSEVSGYTEVPTTLAPQQPVKHSQIVNRGSEEGEGSDTRLRVRDKAVGRAWGRCRGGKRTRLDSGIENDASEIKT